MEEADLKRLYLCYLVQSSISGYSSFSTEYLLGPGSNLQVNKVRHSSFPKVAKASF